MKILQLIFAYHPSVGGTQIFFKNICERLVSTYGDEVEVFTTDALHGPDKIKYEKVTPSFENIRGVNVRRFPFKRWHKKIFRFSGKLLRRSLNTSSSWMSERLIGPWSYSLRRSLMNTDSEVILATSSTFLYMQYPLWRTRIRNPKPFVFQGAIHFTEDENYLPFSKKTLCAIKLCEAYLANTTYEKERLEKIGISGEKIMVTGSAVDVSMFSNGNRAEWREKLTVTEDEILIAYVGRLASFKGIDILLQAFSLAQEKIGNLRLIVAGFDNNYLHVLKDTASSFSTLIREKIHFLLNISETEKIDLFHAMDMLVLPSLNESFGMVFLEAWACKKPVVGADIGAIRSVITDGADGLLMKPGNTEDLAEKIIMLAGDPSARREMGEAGYRKTMENFTWEIVTEKIRATCLNAIESFAAGKLA